MSKTDKTKPYKTRVREAGGTPYSDFRDSDAITPEIRATQENYPANHLLRPTYREKGMGPETVRFYKRLRSKRIRREDVPNTKATWDMWW